jgi:hypothetical protein
LFTPLLERSHGTGSPTADDLEARKTPHRGGVVYYLGKHAHRTLEREVGSKAVSRLSDYSDSYVVSSTGDDTLVTAGYRYKRFNPS